MKKIASALILSLLCVCAVYGRGPAFRLFWASTDSHCVEGAKPSVEFADEAFECPAWRGERVFAQALVLAERDLKNVSLEVSGLRCGKAVIESGCVKPQFVSFVTSDLLDSTSFGQCKNREDKSKWGEVQVADIIDINPSADIPAGKIQPLWITVSVPSDAKPGKYSGKLTVTADGGVSRSLPIRLTVSDRQLPPVGDWTFHLDLWQNPWAVARVTGVPLWSDGHFEVMRPVMELLAGAGQKSVTATIMNRPWNGQTEDPFGTMVTKIRRADGSWLYDYTVFDRWVEFMFSLGIDRQINCYSMIPWAMEFDCFNQATNSVETLRAAAGSKEYNDYWGSFLKDFAAHLKEKGWFEKTLIAMDERPLDAMQAVLALIREVEPGFRISLAGRLHAPIIYDIDDFSESFASKDELTDDVKARRRELGQTTTVYTCCAEARPNLYTISSPAEAVWLCWFAAAEGYDGYLRWAYNSWTADPLTDARFRTWPAGDCFVVYPGGRSSVHFAKLTEGIQNYEKVKILREEWEREGDSASLERLDTVLKTFTTPPTDSAEAGKAVKAARRLFF